MKEVTKEEFETYLKTLDPNKTTLVEDSKSSKIYKGKELLCSVEYTLNEIFIEENPVPCYSYYTPTFYCNYSV